MNSQRREWDPVFINSRREAIIIFTVWAICLCWAVPYCYVNGFGVVNPDELTMVFGVPSWVWWGIFLPWLLADVFTIWFCCFYMTDDDLSAAEPVIDADGDAIEQSTRDEGAPP